MSADGRLHIFDLSVSKLAPVLSVAVTDDTLADAADASKVSSTSSKPAAAAAASSESGDGSSKSKPSGIAAFRAAALAAKATAAFSSAGTGAVGGNPSAASGTATSAAKAKVPSRPVAAHCVAWNGHDGSLLAVGDSRGVVSVWQVSPRLATLQVTDKAVLDKLSIAAATADEAD